MIKKGFLTLCIPLCLFSQLLGSSKANGEISLEKLAKVKAELEKDSTFRITRNALTNVELQHIALNWDRYVAIDHTFSHCVYPELAATDQYESGRCWIFAGLNLMRIPFCREHNIHTFEFSQSYLFFYDKLEKVNYFLENILKTSNESHDSRLVSYLLKDPICDGGQWDMFTNVVKKYGLVPKSVYPDSFAAIRSAPLNYILTLKLREWALKLRTLKKEGVSSKELSDVKDEMISKAYKILATHFGFPPETFDWEYWNNDGDFVAHRNLTPKTFFSDLVKFPLDDMVCLVNSPRAITPYNQTYVISYLGNVVGGKPITYLNVNMDVIRQATIDTIKDNNPVFFGCDVAKFFHGGLGVMDTELFEYDILYDMPFTLDKVSKMNYGETQITHAMLFTGVNLIDGVPNRWRVENSWGRYMGDQGYFVMTDKWFEEYMLEVVINKKYLSDEVLKNYQKKPQILPPWDPLGALAN